MALSNIFNEPRRELTESVVGIAVFAAVVTPLVIADYLFSLWFHEATGGGTKGCPWQLGMLLGVLFAAVGLLLISGLLGLTHAIGEDVCNALERLSSPTSPL